MTLLKWFRSEWAAAGVSVAAAAVIVTVGAAGPERIQQVEAIYVASAAGAADLHALHAFVPAADDRAVAEVEVEVEGIVAILAGVEFAAAGLRGLGVVEPAVVVDGDLVVGGGGFAGAGDGVFLVEAGGGGEHAGIPDLKGA